MVIGDRVKVRWGYGAGYRVEGEGVLVKVNRRSLVVELSRPASICGGFGGTWTAGCRIRVSPNANAWDAVLPVVSAYESRVRQLEAQGCTRSDAQGVADAEDRRRLPCGHVAEAEIVDGVPWCGVCARMDAEELTRCPGCGEANDDGEGWDGRCGNCADREARREDRRQAREWRNDSGV